ncbi:hypothetical protein N5C60_01360 [Pseudomonas mosselii]|uniref:hypothetical protein n=1 Tax=Pseudomonas mosselii TaxID=78327 RepID=UPI002446C56C|nr:hypothetical protein [Pseudomonas mosselii]MDH1143257.1 hypothetical protein [Pseudomonas mosselii]
MPTENRSSNTEMVSVPRERALQLINLLSAVASAAHWLADNSEDCGDEGIDCQRADFDALSDALDKCEELPELPDSVYVRDGWLRAADELRALLAQPTEQHQGEPAAVFSIDATGYRVRILESAINSLPADGTKLYTHPAPADPGEVEQIREGRKLLLEDLDRRDATVADLRAQLAEKDALLRGQSGKLIVLAARLIQEPLRVLGGYLDNEGPITRNKTTHGVEQGGDSLGGLALEVRRVADALSASAEPSAPVAWHVGGNGYDRICFEEPRDLPGHPCVQAISDQRQLTSLLKRYNLRDEEQSAPVERDERAELEAYCTKVGLPLDRLPSGEYLIPATRFVSQGWHAHARAALERKP